MQTLINALYHDILYYIDDSGQDIYAYGPTCINERDWTFTRLDHNFYSGSGGLLLSLAAYAYSTHCSAAKHLAKRLQKTVLNHLEQYSNIGFSGFSGNVYALMMSSVWLNTSTFQLNDLLKLINVDKQKLDFIDGLASLLVLLNNLHKAGYLRQLDYNLVYSITDYILSHKKDCWIPSPHFPNPTCGLSHGYSGYAFALAAAYQLTNDERLLGEITCLLDEEDNYFNRQQCNWPDLRHDENTFADFWCHGSCGIYLARQTIHKLTQLDVQYIDVAYRNSLAMFSKTENLSLCHGLGGLMEVCIQQNNTKQQQQFFASIENRKCGLPLDVLSIGFMPGLAGALYQLLRMQSPLTIPNALLLDIPENTT